MKKNLNLAISLSNSWDNTKHVQEATWNIIQLITADPGHSDSISMVCTELVENAIKYGDSSYSGEDAIQFSLQAEPNEVLVEVKNRMGTEDSESNIRELDKTIQWIRGFQNPHEAYVERLRMASRIRSGASRLGMVRIAYEGGAIPDFFVDDENRISISATIPLT